MKTHLSWLELTNYNSDPTDVDSSRGGIAIVNNTLKKYVSGAWSAVEGGEGSSTFVGLSDTPSNFTDAANKILKVNNEANAVEFVTIGGDITIGATGTAAIASGVIVNDDISDSADIAWSKLANGVSFVVSKAVTNLSPAGTNIITTHPKLKVIDVWFVATSNISGTICVHAGQVGSVGDAITDVMSIPAADKGITRATEIDDATWEVAENGGLVAVGDIAASIDGTIFVHCIKVD